MPRLLLNSDTTKTTGAINPCQRPSEKPATPPCSLAVPLDRLGPGAHPAKIIINSRTSTSTVKDDFTATPPTNTDTKEKHEKSQTGRCAQTQSRTWVKWGCLTHRRRAGVKSCSRITKRRCDPENSVLREALRNREAVRIGRFT